jgi:hypothetical protein
MPHKIDISRFHRFENHLLGKPGKARDRSALSKRLEYGRYMIMRTGRIYRCQNERCRAEIKVTKDSIEGKSNPRCCCGAEMKKSYSKPALTPLEPTTELTALFTKKA